MLTTYAYLLVAHGSRDPRPQIALERLSYLVEQHIEQKTQTESYFHYGKTHDCAVQSPVTIVQTATLELSALSLSEKITKLAPKIASMGIKTLKIIPLFLLAGVHVREDIPREIAIAQQKVSNRINLELCPHLGSYKGLVKILSHQFSSSPQDARIIISHGSRFPGGNNSLEAIADKLDARLAYWSIAPSLEEQVSHLVEQGKTQITILPYFLFTGGITTAINQRVQKLKDSFPRIQLNLGQPLGATPDIAQLMVKEIIQ
ncbi:MAG: sirohydrochlorin chelatase [Crocosphaera sp.]|nr:sirohydrochlorin chelatase [Crocosphaera sp.]